VLNEAWKWRSAAIEFLERLIKEAIYEAHKYAKNPIP
jgi:hypothetical protein